MVAAPVILFPVVLVVGALVGCWVDYAAAAIPERRSVWRLPGCPNCGQAWRGLALVPVVGGLLRRRCAQCDETSSLLRPLTEVVTGLLFAIALWRFGVTLEFVATCVFTTVLLIILRIDWRHHLIFQQTILLGLALALGYAIVNGRQPHAFLWSAGAALGAALLFLLFYALAIMIYRRRALGFGDVLLAALIGAMTGPNAYYALLIGMLLGAGGGLFLVAIRVRQMRDYIPYGAYLCVGTIITLLVR